jgi:hypothetical protein
MFFSKQIPGGLEGLLAFVANTGVAAGFYVHMNVCRWEVLDQVDISGPVDYNMFIRS